MKKRNIGIVLAYVNTGLNMACGLFLSSYLLRILGDTEYGVYQTVASFANYLVLLEFGTGTVMTRNISMCRGRKAEQSEIQRNVTTVWMLACILGSVILAVAAVFYLWLPSIYAATLSAPQIALAEQIFLFVIVHLVASFLAQTLNGVILAYEHYRYGAVMNISRTVLRFALLVGMLCFQRSALIIAQVDALLSVVQFCFSGLYIRRHFRLRMAFGRMDAAVLRTAAPLAAALFLQTVVNQANNNVDKFLIGIMLSPEHVSLYSVGMYVYSVFSSMTTIPISMFAPVIARKMQENPSMELLKAELAPPCRLTAMIGGAIYFGFLAMGKPFVELVYGAEYTDAWLIAVIVMTPMYINMINGVLVNVLDVLNKRMIRSAVLIATTAANILLTVVWMDRWGVIGAALATGLCTLLGQVLIMNFYYGAVLKIDVIYLFRAALAGILPWFAAGCAAASSIGARVEDTLLTLIVRFAVFCVTVVAGYLLKGIREEEKAALRRLISGRCAKK